MAFGWTPEQIRSLDEDDRMAYVMMLKGNNEEIKKSG